MRPMQGRDDGGSIARLALPPYLRSRLLGCGYNCVNDLRLVSSPLNLAREASISPEEALLILKHVPSASPSAPPSLAGAQTAWDLLNDEKGRSRIVTSCIALDRILGGGIPPKDLTEICGVPGIGKTQLGMQLAINAQMPFDLGGLAGHAVYIDTEGSFMLERAVQMAQACANLVKNSSTEMVTVEQLLARIYYFRVFGSTEQIAMINSLTSFLEHHPQVRLVVLDSVTFHFRQDFEDLALRTRLLNSMAQKLLALAHAHSVAVVLVNQVTTKSNGEVTPALGESWSHNCTTRVILRWVQGKRQACIYKSPCLPLATADFRITSEGIEG